MSAPPPAGRTLADGAIRGFAAELLLLPTGLVTAAVLARVLGPADYGRFSLVASVVTWLTLTTSALLSRAAIKFVSEAHDWRPVAALLLRTRSLIGLGGTVALVVGAGAVAGLLGDPGLAVPLRVFAIDLVLTNLVRVYRETLTGIGKYRAVAAISVVRWSARMVLMVTFVLWRRSVLAAVVASVLTTVVELAVASRLLPMPWRARGGPSPRQLWSVAAPLLVFGLALQLHTRIDLFAVSALQRHAADPARDVGWFGAAQNLAVAPGLLAMTLAPLLLATLGRLRRDRHDDQARAVARDVIRFAVALLPSVAIVFACAPELVARIFGPAFLGAARLLGPLFAGGIALCILVVSVAILTAAEQTAPVSRLGLWLIASSTAGHLVMVPRFGAIGAAMVTAATSLAVSLIALWQAHRVWSLRPSPTFVRAAVVGVAVYFAGGALTTTSWWGLSVKLALLSAAAAGGLILLGEFSAADRARIRPYLPTWFQRIGQRS